MEINWRPAVSVQTGRIYFAEGAFMPTRCRAAVNGNQDAVAIIRANGENVLKVEQLLARRQPKPRPTPRCAKMLRAPSQARAALPSERKRSLGARGKYNPRIGQRFSGPVTSASSPMPAHAVKREL
jgi:hypothetical protein